MHMRQRNLPTASDFSAFPCSQMPRTKQSRWRDTSKARAARLSTTTAATLEPITEEQENSSKPRAARSRRPSLRASSSRASARTPCLSSAPAHSTTRPLLVRRPGARRLPALPGAHAARPRAAGRQRRRRPAQRAARQRGWRRRGRQAAGRRRRRGDGAGRGRGGRRRGRRQRGRRWLHTSGRAGGQRLGRASSAATASGERVWRRRLHVAS